MGRCKALLGSKSEPRHRLGMVLLDTATFGITIAKAELSTNMALLSGRSVPLHTLGRVLIDASKPCSRPDQLLT